MIGESQSLLRWCWDETDQELSASSQWSRNSGFFSFFLFSIFSGNLFPVPLLDLEAYPFVPYWKMVRGHP